jgi:hypothetical protein
MRKLCAVLLLLVATSACPGGVFVRFKVTEPKQGRFTIAAGGFRHEDPWYLPTASVEATDGAWSPWLDASAWPWHGKLTRAGGIAEWPAMRASVTRAGEGPPIKGCTLDVQLAERGEEAAVVHAFTEKTGSDTIAFLVPTPLRERAKEFETGSQMTARHLKWAEAASAGQPAQLKHFTFCTALWGHYDVDLMRQAVQTLKLLGVNVIGNADAGILRESGIRTYGTTWSYGPDPKAAQKMWDAEAASLKTAMDTDDGRWRTTQATHWVVGDEVQTLNFNGLDAHELNGWFRDYLRAKGVQESDLGRPIDQVEYPAKAMYEKSLPRGADLPTRKLMYHAAKFGHGYSAKRLRATSDLVRATLPGMKTETLPSDHGFFHAWGPPHIGMSYRMLDLFELGSQRVVDEISAEDWLGLNHMYGPQYTWTGAQTFGYFNAICRSAMLHAPGDGEPMMLRSLITPSDDAYLRLKGYSAIGQGSKSFFFWTFGPTYIGTENYWSDLRSEYDGIAKLSRAVAKAEHVLHPAKVVRDPVAILYSVSHDVWHTDNAAAFVEKRLLWHALRHAHVQPDFLREEDVEAGRLKDYNVLYVADWCVTRAASAKIDEWVKAGGVVQLSAGAATRDEFYEPYVPPYAATVWPDEAARQLKTETHPYNERVDLPTIKPIDSAAVELDGERFSVPVLGGKLPLRPGASGTFATFADRSPAAASISYGQGRVFGIGFLPMLAYGRGATFKPETLEERWPDEPRRLAQLAIDRVTPVARCDTPVVETSLLTGTNGSALVLANYTYRPIDRLTVDVTLSHPVTRATSTEGVAVHMEKTAAGVRLRLPLAWTDIVLLE